MLQLTYKLKIAERVKGKCNRHPRFNPEKDGRAGIRGACSCCFSLYDLYQARLALDAAQCEFIRGAAPWAQSREPRLKNRTQQRSRKLRLFHKMRVFWLHTVLDDELSDPGLYATVPSPCMSTSPFPCCRPDPQP